MRFTNLSSAAMYDNMINILRDHINLQENCYFLLFNAIRIEIAPIERYCCVAWESLATFYFN